MSKEGQGDHRECSSLSFKRETRVAGHEVNRCRGSRSGKAGE